MVIFYNRVVAVHHVAAVGSGADKAQRGAIIQRFIADDNRARRFDHDALESITAVERAVADLGDSFRQNGPLQGIAVFKYGGADGRDDDFGAVIGRDDTVKARDVGRYGEQCAGLFPVCVHFGVILVAVFRRCEQREEKVFRRAGIRKLL